MSICISFALAEVSKIEAAAGSCDDELFDRIVDENREDLEADLAEREPEELSELEALRRLIFDDYTGNDWNNTFNHAFCTLASGFDCRWLEDIDVEWVKSLGDELAALNIDAARPEWFTEGCHWSHEDCRRVWQQWEAVTPDQRASLTPEAAKQIGLWMGWVEEAVSTTTLGIFGVFFAEG
ncbi:hypothetical protein ACFXHA_05220 [Nocardia sp. NPDC059240]|uniref:DUF7691 family protein n=1 Tax=Nocardia sp. NPDC059240 TaxID=3346786 RepID=UPI0036B75502